MPARLRLIAWTTGVSLFLAMPAMPQDQEQAPEPAEDAEQATDPEQADAAATGGEATEPEETAADEPDAEIYDPELDDQTYEGDDKVFVPTEEIPADEAIPFPTDI
ncbi:MAG: hypothetical protein WD448_07790 [Woeseia sp.]